MEDHPPGKALGRLFKQFRRGTAKNQKACRYILAVRQHPQQGKNIRAQLDFVQHHQPCKLPQSKGRVGKASLIVWIFQIKVTYRTIPSSRKLARKRCLANLPRAKNSHDREIGKLPRKQVMVG
jgi:hypothetical protein